MWKWIPVAACVLSLGVGAASGQTAPRPPAKPSSGTTAPTPSAAVKKPQLTPAVLRNPPAAIATVNGEPITVEQFFMQLALTGGPQIMDRLVFEKMLRQEARKQRVAVTDKEVMERVDRNLTEFAARFQTADRFDQYLKRQHRSRDGFRRMMRPGVELTLLQERLRDKVTASVTVTDEEIAAKYQAEINSYREPDTAIVSHILVTVNSGDPYEDQKARKKAEEILARVKAAEGKNFAEVAKEASEDAETKGNGGELPPIRRPSFYGLPFDEAIFTGSPGLIPEPVRSVRGWHVLMLKEKTPARTKTLDQVKESLKEQILQQKRAERFRQYMVDAEKNTRTDIRLQF